MSKMTKAEIVVLLRHRLGFNTAFDETEMLTELAYIQSIYENGEDGRLIPWFCLDMSATLTTVANQATVDLPDQFTSLDDDFPLSIVSPEGVKKALPRAKYHEFAAGAEVGFPGCFDLVAEQLVLYPTPDAAYTINFPHYARTTKLTETDDSPWYYEFPTLLVEEAAFVIMRSNRDTEGLKLSNLQEVRNDYHRRVEARKHLLQNYEMGPSL